MPTYTRDSHESDVFELYSHLVFQLLIHSVAVLQCHGLPHRAWPQVPGVPEGLYVVSLVQNPALEY